MEPVSPGEVDGRPEFLGAGNVRHRFPRAGPAEIGNAANVGFTTYIDPVRCPVTDLPADCGQGQAGQSTAGNPFIKPETSDTWTAGFIWEPTAGLSATVDYWYIKTKNLIAQPDVQAVINNPSQFPGTSVVRSQTDNLPGIPDSGTLLLVNGAYQNLASQVVDGLDVDLLWKYNTTNYGRYTTEVQWSHYFQFKRTIGGQTIDYVNSHGPTSLSGSAGTPQDRVNVILGWTRGRGRPRVLFATSRRYPNSRQGANGRRRTQSVHKSTANEPELQGALVHDARSVGPIHRVQELDVLRLDHQRVQPLGALRPAGRIWVLQLQR